MSRALRLACSLGICAAASWAEPVPRPISAAERAAVELALAYAERGAAAWVERRAAGSWLGALPAAEAAAEIAARCGPAEAAHWRLQTPAASFGPETAIFTVEFPSGIDETVVLTLAEASGVWTLADLRSLVDPVAAARGVTSNRATLPPAGAPVIPRAAGSWLGAALLAAAAALAVGPARRRPAVAVGALLALAVGALACQREADGDSTAPEPATARLRLAPLEPLRRALAAGTDRAAIDRELAALPADPPLQRVAALWSAQLAWIEGHLRAVEQTLAALPEPSGTPLAELLRARLALSRFQTGTTGWAYTRAIDQGPDHDGLRLEAIQANSWTGEESRASVELALVVEMGSRLAEPWYASGREALIAERGEEAEQRFATGWKLAPLPRRELFDDPATAALVARSGSFALFELHSAEEPKVAPAERGTAAIAPPVGTEATLAGAELTLRRGEYELTVPNGAPLAPPAAVVESADARDRRRESRALAARPQLVAAAANADRFTPRQIHLAEVAGKALLRERRWEEIVALTANLAHRVDAGSALLARLRGFALLQLGRQGEARELLIRLAKRELELERPAPGTLYDLAEVLAKSGELETAIRLIRKADARLPFPAGERRLRQFEMSRDLEVEARSHRSPHFDVRYPRGTGERYARQLVVVLEEERRRLLRWIPSPGSERIVVELFPVQQFLSSYGGAVAVAGVFDGRVRVPFADLRSLHPQLVEILSHELAHAMIAGATRDQAPKWFHEGLAEHVEMGTGRVNPLKDLQARGHVLAFSTVEPILAGFAEPQLVDLAYSEAAWAVHFLESRWGVSALHRMQRAFADGLDTERAIHRVTGLDLAAFDRAFWRWGTESAPAARTLEVRRYDLEYDSLIQRDLTAKAVQPVLVAPSATEERELLARQRLPRITSWHAAYLERAAAVKSAYKPVLASFRAPDAPPPAPADCQQLATAARRVLADPRSFDSSDADVDRTLRETYRLLADLGDACAAGKSPPAQLLFERIGQAMGVAASALARYGLAP